MTNPTPAFPEIKVDSFWLPEASSTAAGHIDWAYYFVYYFSVFFFVLVVGVIIYASIRFRRKTPDQKAKSVPHSLKLEVAWTLIPAAGLMCMFAMGVSGFMKTQVAPGNALEIQVTAQMWNWVFTYPNGVVSGELIVPKDQPVRMVMSSVDTIHSFWIPTFRVKQDVVPGMYTTIWFEANREGETTLECAEYCGTNHSHMMAKVVVKPAAAFKTWLDNGGTDVALTPADLGKKLFSERGCNACHSTDGAKGVGPSLKGVWGHEAEMSDGAKVKVDENYIRESLMNPGAKIVKGFQGVMPSFEGQLTDKDVNGIIAYLKTVE